LKQKNPELDFGQLSTQISKMWSALSKEEQNAYALPACVQKEKKSVELDATVLKEKKMSELRQLCEERGLKRTGNKSELIRTLLEKQETVPQTVPKVNFTHDIEHDSLEVDMLNTIIKRADIEEGEANLESEEEDFDFDEEENYEADVFEE
jgi:alanine racemase